MNKANNPSGNVIAVDRKSKYPRYVRPTYRSTPATPSSAKNSSTAEDRNAMLNTDMLRRLNLSMAARTARTSCFSRPHKDRKSVCRESQGDERVYFGWGRLLY